MVVEFRRQAGVEGVRRSRRRHAVAALPTLFTLGNCLCGFAAMHYAAIGDKGAPDVPISNYAIAGYLIFASMLFDMLDGRMARLAKATSDFGGELDSLADMVSFGAAPAFVATELIGQLLSDKQVHFDPGPLSESVFGRLLWISGGIYVACTALRLARFNIHNRHGEEAHMDFRGLPSPGAAGVVASSVIFYQTLQPASQHWLPQIVLPGVVTDGFLWIFPYTMPVILVVMAGLMVSRFSYGHVINRYLRGRRSFMYVVRLVALLFLVIWQPQITALLAIVIYAFSAPVTWGVKVVMGRKAEVKLVEKEEESR